MNNACWGAEKAYQRDFFGQRYIGSDLSSPPFDELARLYGAEGYRVSAFRIWKTRWPRPWLATLRRSSTSRSTRTPCTASGATASPIVPDRAPRSCAVEVIPLWPAVRGPTGGARAPRFLPDQHSGLVADRVQALLVQLAGPPVLAHHLLPELRSPVEIEVGVGEGLRGEEPRHHEPGAFGGERKHLHQPRVVDVGDQDCTGPQYPVGLSGAASSSLNPSNHGEAGLAAHAPRDRAVGER